jgi:hypothetical protein
MIEIFIAEKLAVIASRSAAPDRAAIAAGDRGPRD